MMLKHNENYERLFKAGPYLGDFVEIQKKSDAISQISEITVN